MFSLPVTAYLSFLFSCTQNVFRHPRVSYHMSDILKTNSTLDSGVFIFYLYSLACCFLIHYEKRLWSNLALTYFLEDTKYFVISEVC